MAFFGFPSGTRYTSVPNPLLGPLMEEIQDLAELKVVLRGIWLLQRSRSWPRMVSQSEFLADVTLNRAFQRPEIRPHMVILEGLKSAVARGIFLAYEDSGQVSNSGMVYYLLNTENDRRALSKLEGRGSSTRVVEGPGETGSLGSEYVPSAERPNIFTIYEDNIGMVSPMLAEELKEAEELYPWVWLADAFKIAVSRNQRSWNYVRGILRRWAAEGRTGSKTGLTGESRGTGREDGKPGRHSAAGDRQKYIEDYQRRRGQIPDKPARR